MPSADASVFLVVDRALAADPDDAVLFVQVNRALFCLDVRVSSHDGVVNCAGKRHFVLITELVVKLEEGGEGNGVIGEDGDFDLHVLLGQGQQLAFDEVHVDLDQLEMSGGFPFADSDRVISVVL